MSLTDRFATTPTRSTARCLVADTLDKITDRIERGLVIAALDDLRPSKGGAWSDEVIAAGLTDEGYPISRNAVRRHRDRRCGCPQ